MGFVLVAQPTSHVGLFERVDALERRGEGVRGKWEEGASGTRRFFEYRIVPQVPLTQSGSVMVNFVELWERTTAGKVLYHNSWVTDFTVTPETVATISGMGRARWKIETAQFNVQKNHGYELEHNYGHGQQTLSMVFYLLNLFAFIAHMILERGDRLYQRCLATTSRQELWHTLRTTMRMILVGSWVQMLRLYLDEEPAGP